MDENYALSKIKPIVKAMITVLKYIVSVGEKFGFRTDSDHNETIMETIDTIINKVNITHTEEL